MPRRILFNTTELETCVYSSLNPAGNGQYQTDDAGSVPSKAITAGRRDYGPDAIKAQNGTVTFNQDLNVP